MLACSGPGAAEIIEANAAIGSAFAGANAAMFLVSITVFVVGRRGKVAPCVCGVLLLLHPAWTVGARGGDCGRLLIAISYVFALVAAFAFLIQLHRAIFRRTAPPPSAETSSAPD
mgnify:CR=1 FL=1